MANFGLTIPNEKAVFRYSYRDTGQSWSSDILMNGGAGDADITFASPVCDELRLIATFDQAANFNRVHFSNLSIVTGLSFDVDYGSGSNITAQAVETRPKLFQNQTLRTSDSGSVTVVTVIITGIGQQSLTFDQVIFGELNWIPGQNFEDGSQYRQGSRFSRQRTRSSSKQRLEDNARILPITFLKLTESEYLDLEYYCDELSANGYMLAELDSAGGSEHDSFLAECSVSAFASKASDLKQCQLQLIEKNTQ